MKDKPKQEPVQTAAMEEIEAFGGHAVTMSKNIAMI